MLFNTKVEAKSYIQQQTIGCHIIEPETQFVLASDIISQEHLGFKDLKSTIIHNFSILERLNSFEVIHKKKMLSQLVLACESGDFEKFERALAKPNSENALALAFTAAIRNDRLEFIEMFIKKDLVPKNNLYKNPLETSTECDSLASFKYLKHLYEIPENFLAHILRHNAKQILTYIMKDKELNFKIFNKEYMESEWVQRLDIFPNKFTE